MESHQPPRKPTTSAARITRSQSTSCSGLYQTLQAISPAQLTAPWADLVRMEKANNPTTAMLIQCRKPHLGDEGVLWLHSGYRDNQEKDEGWDWATGGARTRRELGHGEFVLTGARGARRGRGGRRAARKWRPWAPLEARGWGEGGDEVGTEEEQLQERDPLPFGSFWTSMRHPTACICKSKQFHDHAAHIWPNNVRTAQMPHFLVRVKHTTGPYLPCHPVHELSKHVIVIPKLSLGL
jgi:hypothetical protein